MKIVEWVMVLLLMSSLGCGDDEDDTNSTLGDGTGHGDGGRDSEIAIDHCADPVGALDGDGNFVVIAEDRLNYSFESTLAVQTVEVKSMSDLTFDWSEVTTDMLGHDFDPLKSVDMMELMLWQYDKPALIEAINSDDLDTSLLVSLGQIPTGNEMSSAQFLDLLSPSGDEVDDALLLEYVDPRLYAPDEHTYFVMVAEGSVFGHGTKNQSKTVTS